MSLYVVGSVNQDVTSYVEAFPQPGETLFATDTRWACGGKGLNQACMCGLMSEKSGLAGMLACVGDDDAGKDVIKCLGEFGVKSHVLTKSCARTGQATITVDSTGENNIILFPGANYELTALDVESDKQLREAQIVVCQNEIKLKTSTAALRGAKQGNALTIFNPAPACPVSTIPQELLQNTDILIPNETEAAVLLGQPDMSFSHESDFEAAATQLKKLTGVKVVIVTAGKKGIVFVGTDAMATWVSPPKMDGPAIDTSGAGDCFIGAFSYALLEATRNDEKAKDLSKDVLIKCIRIGCSAASISVQKRGCQISYPDRKQVEAACATYDL